MNSFRKARNPILVTIIYTRAHKNTHNCINLTTLTRSLARSLTHSLPHSLTQVSIRSSYTNTPLFATLRSPTICGLRASTTHFSDPLKNAMPQISPNLHSVGGKFSAAQTPNIFTCFCANPARSGPGATILHSVGGPFAHLDSGIQLRTANLMGPCGGPPRCRAPSVPGPGASFSVVSPRLPTRDVLRDKLTR